MAFADVAMMHGSIWQLMRIRSTTTRNTSKEHLYHYCDVTMRFRIRRAEMKEKRKETGLGTMTAGPGSVPNLTGDGDGGHSHSSDRCALGSDASIGRRVASTTFAPRSTSGSTDVPVSALRSPSGSNSQEPARRDRSMYLPGWDVWWRKAEILTQKHEVRFQS
ncbi:hypothetical protein AJ79_09281 [Helicocarpus griseus UAMH5409]|uniref:Uncharacterized protein n=1 Tax=Helicocarpus griseus UAMH5409 TaxID=1447875 RepID=A0A2B7WKG2_9EURO|nr:hypothetical protein AJ79_09281 [Helicocarpus griseus UAMH5409]